MENCLEPCGGFSGKREKEKIQNILGWPKIPYVFFHKIKDMFLIFTNSFIDLDILSVSAISFVV